MLKLQILNWRQVRFAPIFNFHITNSQIPSLSLLEGLPTTHQHFSSETLPIQSLLVIPSIKVGPRGLVKI